MNNPDTKFADTETRIWDRYVFFLAAPMSMRYRQP